MTPVRHYLLEQTGEQLKNLPAGQRCPAGFSWATDDYRAHACAECALRRMIKDWQDQIDSGKVWTKGGEDDG